MEYMSTYSRQNIIYYFKTYYEVPVLTSEPQTTDSMNLRLTMSDSTNAGPGQMLDQEKCWTSTNIGMVQILDSTYVRPIQMTYQYKRWSKEK